MREQSKNKVKDVALNVKVEPLADLKKNFRKELDQLIPIFPDWGEDDLVLTLEEAYGDVELATTRILEGHAAKWTDGKSKKNNANKDNNHHTNNSNIGAGSGTTSKSSQKQTSKPLKPNSNSHNFNTKSPSSTNGAFQMHEPIEAPNNNNSPMRLRGRGGRKPNEMGSERFYGDSHNHDHNRDQRRYNDHDRFRGRRNEMYFRGRSNGPRYRQDASRADLEGGRYSGKIKSTHDSSRSETAWALVDNTTRSVESSEGLVPLNSGSGTQHSEQSSSHHSTDLLEDKGVSSKAQPVGSDETIGQWESTSSESTSKASRSSSPPFSATNLPEKPKVTPLMKNDSLPPPKKSGTSAQAPTSALPSSSNHPTVSTISSPSLAAPSSSLPSPSSSSTSQKKPVIGWHGISYPSTDTKASIASKEKIPTKPVHKGTWAQIAKSSSSPSIAAASSSPVHAATKPDVEERASELSLLPNSVIHEVDKPQVRQPSPSRRAQSKERSKSPVERRGRSPSPKPIHTDSIPEPVHIPSPTRSISPSLRSSSPPPSVSSPPPPARPISPPAVKLGSISPSFKASSGTHVPPGLPISGRDRPIHRPSSSTSIALPTSSQPTNVHHLGVKFGSLTIGGSLSNEASSSHVSETKLGRSSNTLPSEEQVSPRLLTTQQLQQRQQLPSTQQPSSSFSSSVSTSAPTKPAVQTSSYLLTNQNHPPSSTTANSSVVSNPLNAHSSVSPLPATHSYGTMPSATANTTGSVMGMHQPLAPLPLPHTGHPSGAYGHGYNEVDRFMGTNSSFYDPVKSNDTASSNLHPLPPPPPPSLSGTNTGMIMNAHHPQHLHGSAHSQPLPLQQPQSHQQLQQHHPQTNPHPHSLHMPPPSLPHLSQHQQPPPPPPQQPPGYPLQPTYPYNYTYPYVFPQYNQYPTSVYQHYLKQQQNLYMYHTPQNQQHTPPPPPPPSHYPTTPTHSHLPYSPHLVQHSNASHSSSLTSSSASSSSTPTPMSSSHVSSGSNLSTSNATAVSNVSNTSTTNSNTTGPSQHSSANTTTGGGLSSLKYNDDPMHTPSNSSSSTSTSSSSSTLRGKSPSSQLQHSSQSHQHQHQQQHQHQHQHQHQSPHPSQRSSNPSSNSNPNSTTTGPSPMYGYLHSQQHSQPHSHSSQSSSQHSSGQSWSHHHSGSNASSATTSMNPTTASTNTSTPSSNSSAPMSSTSSLSHPKNYFGYSNMNHPNSSSHHLNHGGSNSSSTSSSSGHHVPSNANSGSHHSHSNYSNNSNQNTGGYHPHSHHHRGQQYSWGHHN